MRRAQDLGVPEEPVLKTNRNQRAFFIGLEGKVYRCLQMCADVQNPVLQHFLPSAVLLNYIFHLCLGKPRVSEVEEGSPAF